MPKQTRFKTKYPGVYYIESTVGRGGEPERVYYIAYRKEGKLIEEKAGRQFQDDMTPARASGIRAQKMQGREKTNEECRQEERAAKDVEAGKWTVSRLWEEYLHQKGNYKTLKTDTTNFKYIDPGFGGKEPREIIQLDVDRLRIGLLKQKEPQTVKHVLALLKRLANFGTRKGLCEGLPFKIEMPTIHNCKTEDLSPEELTRLLEAIEEEENIQAANFMRMVLFTGMRRGELFKLQWSHVDFERGFINIVDPKGGPSQKIPLNSSARELIESHPRSNSDFVFPGRNGNCRVDIKKQVNRIKQRAGLPKDFRALHGLRHVYASMLASSGQVDMFTLQKLMTHKSPLMTQRYAHLRDESLRRASNLAGDLINQAVSTGSGNKRQPSLRIVEQKG
jgi:integrase